MGQLAAISADSYNVNVFNYYVILPTVQSRVGQLAVISADSYNVKTQIVPYKNFQNQLRLCGLVEVQQTTKEQE